MERPDFVADLGRFFVALFLHELLQVLAQALDLRCRPKDAGPAIRHLADVLAVAVNAPQERRNFFLKSFITIGAAEFSDIKKVVIAYEPIWAIGTGKTASAAQAEEVCAIIRKKLAALYSAAAAEDVSVLYGGSVKGGNVAELTGSADIDGGLVGGASLKADDFLAIINNAVVK